jgi:hypothetical protein
MKTPLSKLCLLASSLAFVCGQIGASTLRADDGPSGNLSSPGGFPPTSLSDSPAGQPAGGGASASSTAKPKKKRKRKKKKKAGTDGGGGPVNPAGAAPAGSATPGTRSSSAK